MDVEFDKTARMRIADLRRRRPLEADAIIELAREGARREGKAVLTRGQIVAAEGHYDFQRDLANLG